jgi:hypothetical protein
MSGKPPFRPSTVRRAILATGLSVVFLGAAASSASAVIFSPPSLDFGNQPRYTISPPRTITLTKEPQLTTEHIDMAGGGDGGLFIDRFLLSYLGTQTCFSGFLTEASPSCTVTISFTPYGPGRINARLLSVGEGGPPKAVATVTGFATKPCIKKKQHAQRLQYKKVCKGFPRYLPSGQ